MMCRIVYTAVPFLGFFPLLCYLLSLRDSGSRYFYLTLATCFLSSLYIEYSMLSAIVASWFMLFVLQLVPITWRQIVAIGAAFALGIVLHVGQNFIYLGWDTGLEELRLTITNRIWGMPTQEELKPFYQSIGVVHHGAHPIEKGVLFAQMIDNLRFLKDKRLIDLTAYLALWSFCVASLAGRTLIESVKATACELWFPAKVLLWAVVAICAPIFLFPAFAQEVNIGGGGANFLRGSLYRGFVRACALDRRWRDVRPCQGFHLVESLLAGQFHCAAAD